MAGISSTTHCSDEKRLPAAPIRVISFPTINWSTFTTRTGMASSANLNLAIGRMLNLIVGKSRLRILPALTGSESASNQLISEDKLIIRSNTKKQLNCAVIAESLLSICFASISSPQEPSTGTISPLQSGAPDGFTIWTIHFRLRAIGQNDAQFSALLLTIKQLRTNREYAYFEAALT